MRICERRGDGGVHGSSSEGASYTTSFAVASAMSLPVMSEWSRADSIWGAAASEEQDGRSSVDVVEEWGQVRVAWSGDLDGAYGSLVIDAKAGDS